MLLYVYVERRDSGGLVKEKKTKIIPMIRLQSAS